MQKMELRMVLSMVGGVGMKLSIFRYLHLDSHLLLMVGLRCDPPEGCHMGMDMAIFRYIYWESSHLVHNKELR